MLNFLLTNDDGLSYGLEKLAQALKKYGLVYASVPKEHMSAKSHSVTIKSIIEIQRLKETISSTEDTILVDGTPVDSCKMGIVYYNSKKFDLVFSGVNNGLNVAKDVIYSGTVAAAREAYLLGIPAVSISINSFYSEYFIENLNEVIDYIFNNKIYEHAQLININLPDNKSKGIKFTKVGQRLHYNQFTKLNDTTYRVDSSFLCYNENEDSDILNLENGYTTITPLTIDQTDITALKGLKKLND